MSRKYIPLKKIMIVSDYDQKHFNWTKEELASLCNCKDTATTIKSRLEAQNIHIKSMYVIEHQSENDIFWASNRHERHPAFKDFQIKIRKNVHFHILIIFQDDSSATEEEIASIIGMSQNALDVIKTEDGCLAYLCHTKYPRKHQYSKDQVITICGKDYTEIYDERCDKWFSAIPQAKKYADGKKKKKDFKELIDKLDNYEITYEEIISSDEYLPVIKEPFYYKKIKDKVETLNNIYRDQCAQIKKIITSKELTNISKEDIGNTLFSVYMRAPHDYNELFINNLINKIKGNIITYDELANTKEYFNLYLRYPDKLHQECCTHLGDTFTQSSIQDIYKLCKNPIIKNIYKSNVKSIDSYILDSLKTPEHIEALTSETYSPGTLLYDIYMRNTKKAKFIFSDILKSKILSKEILSIEQVTKNDIWNSLFTPNNAFDYASDPFITALEEMINSKIITSYNQIITNDLYAEIFRHIHPNDDCIKTLSDLPNNK